MTTVAELRIADVHDGAHRGDVLTVLRHGRNLLAKTWCADGTIKPYDDAKHFTCSPAPVGNIKHQSRLLQALERDPRACLIRGRYVGDEVAAQRDSEFKPGMTRRTLDCFDDQPLHTVLIEVDEFRPVKHDPVQDPEGAIHEFITSVLPAPFHGVSYHWQMSNSAGHAKHAGKLKVHLWFWLLRPYTSAQLRAWAEALGLPVDRSVFNPVQVHYTAAPVFEAGVDDPVPLRSGFVEGPLGDEVDLTIDPALLQASSTSGGRGKRLRDIASTDRIAQVLAERGMVKSQGRDGALNIDCPFADEHSGESGETSTVYYLPHTGGHAEGHFKCLHSHCVGRPRAAFLAALDIVEGVDDFDVVEGETPEEAARSAEIRERNARRETERALKRMVFDDERLRSERIAREGEHQVPTQRIMSGAEMLAELVFLEEGARVAWIDHPRAVLPFSEFKHATAGSVELVKASDKGKPTKVRRADQWLAHGDRKTVRTQTFAPGQGRICLSPDGDLALNLWVPSKTPAPANWRDLARPFFDHVAYLVPIEAERERFLDWVAHIVQQPGVLPHTHYLFVARQTGIGRNWVAYALARVFAGYVALGFDLAESLRSGFNGALSQRLLAVVDELREGGPGGANSPLAEKLKSMLTEQTRRVNPKYGRQHVEFNCCRFLMFSNHDAALPLAENDRRIVVIENPSVCRSADYYTALYRMLDAPDLGAAIGEALRQRDISRFNPGERAPMSEAKARTIRAGRTEIEQAVRDLAAEWPSDCITSTRLQAVVQASLGGRLNSLQGACVAAGIVKYDGRVRVQGVLNWIWVLRDPMKWKNAVPKDVAAECVRGEVHDFDGTE